MGIPTLGLFGPSPDERYRPWGPRAGFVRTPESIAELSRRHDQDPANIKNLMDGLTVDATEDAARALLTRCSDA